jgi:hypothetical protein
MKGKTASSEKPSANSKDAVWKKKNRQRKKGGTALNDFFIGVFGLCFLLSLSLNFLHDTATIPHDHTSALFNSIQSFKSDAKNTIKKRHQRQRPSTGRLEALRVLKNTDRSSSSTTKVAQLNCEKWGGPSNDLAQEMVYWEDISSDEHFVSPFFDQRGGETKYMTFEPDGGGWNNIRMAMESVIGLAIAMGRTLVMPPQKRMYLLGNGGRKQQK